MLCWEIFFQWFKNSCLKKLLNQFQRSEDQKLCGENFFNQFQMFCGQELDQKKFFKVILEVSNAENCCKIFDGGLRRSALEN